MMYSSVFWVGPNRLRPSIVYCAAARLPVKAGVVAASVALMLASACSDEPSATIRRTSQGVAHIAAENLELAAAGVGYAQAEDHVCTLAEAIVRARGERAKFFGPGPDDANIINDFSLKALGTLDGAEAGFPDLSAESQAMLRGYVAGYNQYIEERGSEIADPRCQGQPWVRAIAPADLYAHLRLVAMFASAESLARAGAFFAAVPPGQSPIPAMARADHLDRAGAMMAGLSGSLAARMPDVPASFMPAMAQHNGGDAAMGSNGWALGAELTESGRGGLLANPHFPYSGARRLWEMHLTVGDDLDVYGAGLLGVPIPQIGFNQNVAFTATVADAYRYAIYQLVLKDGDPTTYIKDGQEVAMDVRTLSIEVDDGAGGSMTLTRKFYASEYGPMIALEAVSGNALPAWGGTGAAGQAVAFTFVDAALEGAPHFIDQWLAIGRAKNIAEYKAAFDCRTTLWTNGIASDADGNALLVDGSAVLNVPKAAQDFLRLPQNPIGLGLPLLDGSTSAQDPIVGACGDRLVALTDRPQLERRDFVQNSNDSAWLTNPAAKLSGFSPLYGGADVEQGKRTRLGLMMLAARSENGPAAQAPAGADGLFSARELLDTIYNNRALMSEPSVGVVQALLDRCTAIGADVVNTTNGSRPVSAGCTAIRNWDRLYNVDSRGAHTFRAFLAELGADIIYSVPFDAADPVGTPRAPAAANGPLADDPMLAALGRALDVLDGRSIAYDARLGDVQRVQPYRSATPGGTATALGGAIPWHGGSGRFEGAFNMVTPARGPTEFDSVYPRLVPPGLNASGLSSEPSRGWQIENGTSFHFGLTFTDQGPEAYGLVTYGQSSDPTSSYFRVQSDAYSTKTPRRFAFTEAEIAPDVKSTTEVTLR